jgi:hypothetical protein
MSCLVPFHCLWIRVYRADTCWEIKARIRLCARRSKPIYDGTIKLRFRERGVRHGHNEKTAVLAFRNILSGMPLGCLPGNSGFNQSTLCSSTPPGLPNCRNLSSLGFHLLRGLVDPLEKRALGQRLGNCRELDVCSCFHLGKFPLVAIVPGHMGDVCSGRCWTGCFFTAL